MNNLPEEHRPDDDPTEELPVLSEGLLALAGQHLVEEELSPEEAELLLNGATATGAGKSQQDESACDADPHEATIVLLEGWSDNDWPHEEGSGSRGDETARLREQLEAARNENSERRDSEERLVTRLAQRNAQLAELLEQLHQARQQIHTLQQRLRAGNRHEAELETLLEHTGRQLARWRQLALASTPRPGVRPLAAPASRIGAVTEEVVNVLSWWQDMLVRVSRYRARVLALVFRGPPPRDDSPAPRTTSRQ